MRSSLLLLLVLINGCLKAQVVDDFSDGNLGIAPAWTGDTTSFAAFSNELHLSAPASSGKAWIATQSSSRFRASWELSIRMDFNPSSSNFVKIFLTSDRPELTGPLNGYFVLIGNTTDDVSLYRQTGTGVTKIIDGVDGSVDLSAVRLRLRVTTDDVGNWFLYTRKEDQVEWTSEGMARDETHKVSNWFGIMCTFTSTRSDKFHFDSIRVTGSPWPDQSAPLLSGFKVLAPDQLLLEFDEPLLPSSVVQTANYSILEPGYIISGAKLLPSQESVMLSILTLKEGTEVHLRIRGLTDFAGNVMAETVIRVVYLVPYAGILHDVVFNEILSDPLPPVGLPQFEFIELLNRSPHFINLENWRITDGSSVAVLPFSVWPPGGFITLTDENAVGFQGHVIAVPNFPSLNNSSDHLYLFNDGEVLIDSVAYQSSWHAAEGKADGGWSLERIDPDDFCGLEENWTSSEHSSGGTPGKLNSVYASRPDRFPPVLKDVEVMSDSTLALTFNERLEKPSSEEVAISVTPDVGSYSKYILSDQNQLQVSFSGIFKEKIKYSVQVTGVRDCPGNRIEAASGKKIFFRAEEPDSLDVVINEILFNPTPGGVDFVEIFNRSDKYFRLRGWALTNQISFTEDELKPTPFFQLSPGGYLVFTSSAETLKLFYPTVPDSVIAEMELPSLPDDAGMIFLTDAENEILDGLSYSEKYHLQLIRDEEGVSLERVDPFASSSSSDNWRSAAFGRATPGLRNSVFSESRISASEVSVEPEVFSIGSGTEFVKIVFNLSDPDLFSSVHIYDLEGRLIKELTDNRNLGRSGFLRWDGDRSDGRAVDPGMYVLTVDLYNDSGYLKRCRFRLVVVK